MNCYSCPGALGACPIGALQAVLTERHRRFPFYVLGYLTMIGLLAGRFVCGWLCLFGLLQELLYKIPTPKLRIPEKPDKTLRYLKYAVLLIMVVELPLIYRSKFGAGEPFFCKYLCPVGTLEGGIPLVLLNDMLRPALGQLFKWKMLLLVICILASVFIYRPFCKYICPLGAFYSLFQPVSLLKMEVATGNVSGEDDGGRSRDFGSGTKAGEVLPGNIGDESKIGRAGVCSEANAEKCGICSKVCQMNVNPRKNPNSPECIRCGECIDACPKNAIRFNMAGRDYIIRKK